jgi:GTP cyclohydrolase I
MSEDMELIEANDHFDEEKFRTPESRNGVSREQALNSVKTLLQWAGDNPNREGLKDTPDRVIRSYIEFFKGYTIDPQTILSKTFSEVDGYSDMVVLTNIRLESYCEHHMVPFIGVAHVGYYPDKRVVGISKLARVVEAYAKRLQIQESLSQQICNCIMAVLKPKGAGVVIEAEHQCMSTRGIHKPGVKMVTSSMMGLFQDEKIQRNFLTRIGK